MRSIFLAFKERKQRIILIAVLTGVCCYLTYHFRVMLGIDIIFTHFFYLPIILASLWCGRRGVFVAVFLAGLDLITHAVYIPHIPILGDGIRAIMFIVIAVTVAVLSKRITKAEEKIRHLNLVLRTIRNVNQLITKEKDRGKLLEGACKNLTEGRGYYSVWIALLDESGKLTEYAESGLGNDFKPMVEYLKQGSLPACGQTALKQAEVIAISDPLSECSECPLSASYARRAGMVVRLEHGGKVYGLMSVSIPLELANDEEELGLFHELAEDIAFTLYNIEMEVKRKKAEEELSKYREHLEELVDQRTKELKEAQEVLVRSERLVTLGQVSGSISHELRNPLGVIDSSVYYLKSKLKGLDEKTLEHLERIRAAVSSSTAIIESLLNLTRMKEPQVEKLDLSAVTSDAIDTSKIPAAVKTIKHFPEPEVTVSADREQLRMALKNIVKNAVQAMDGEGTLTVTVRRSSDSQAEVTFADTGPGIAPENLSRVFEPLFSTRAKGIGFGLSIVRMIIDKHGGTAEAESELGKGAIIIIRLPLYSGENKEGISDD